MEAWKTAAAATRTIWKGETLITTTKGARRAIIAAVAMAAFAAGAFPASARVQCGKASWYAMHTRTASGERANPQALVAAHKTLPFGTMVKVENLRNGKSVVVRINDRGPFVRGRVIDLSKRAANDLGFVSRGVASVRVSVIGKDGEATAATCG